MYGWHPTCRPKDRSPRSVVRQVERRKAVKSAGNNTIQVRANSPVVTANDWEVGDGEK